MSTPKLAIVLVAASALHGAADAAVIYEFTTAGQSGRFGPSQAQVDSAYGAGNSLFGQVTSVGGIQQWTVQTSGLYQITAAGAAGGQALSNGSTTTAGRGALLVGQFTFEAGDILDILVGQMGGSTNYQTAGAGGGGGSFVVGEGDNPLLIAAGGNGEAATAYGYGNAPDGNATADTQTPPSSVSNRRYGAGGGGFSQEGLHPASGNNTQPSWGGRGATYLQGGAGGYSFNSGAYTGEGGFGGGGGTVHTGGGGGGWIGGQPVYHADPTDYHAFDSAVGALSYNTGLNAFGLSGANNDHGYVTVELLEAVSDVPAPGALALFGLAAMGLGIARRRTS
ncbi:MULTISPECIES: PEP-CTERM sorting domain-containing protein [Pacificimonas]|nr:MULTISPECIES: PEP-CTERM sorting domain-containing protein [Pacificimonas]MBZ6378740.1 PEP-CTERM sorting domain-containing protein [Pacificimonas aurantium]